MQWERLTVSEFAEAVRETGVCVVNMAVLERHSEHLPLGTDFLLGHRLACLAAEKEPAVVFPPYCFGKVYEASCYPGAIALKPSLLVELALNVFDEISRNGFHKILLFNSHGGNGHLLSFLVQSSISENKPYTLYLNREFIVPELRAAHQAIMPINESEHAGEIETCLMLDMFPELVQLGRVPDQPAEPLGRLKDLPGLFTAMHWYGNFPEHYSGDARHATSEKAVQLREIYVESLARQIAAVKADKITPALKAEFFKRMGELPSL